ncbi:probable helicase senataxin isoform X1 [Manacus candei]|uniref:probable helicase senataxin isoform X1 n=1 Tax=Manacus candei TaxID=415023 RepID=UPI0022261A8E|nr:probable helicase senataxin isoform X1 [Manacus candei]XP_051663409.1 probable helicase senataxin isoform X1 [Manacus candei]XP_051663410.1 probable helicase senataxin isoform X1 [Manacus candei]XP_051663411.1 probable helicase senataxin isoform X1 [Manacus candei]
MSTCRWCTPSGPDTTEFLKHYATEQLSQEEFEGSNDDLSYCLECVVEYHKAREECPRLHKDLWDLETARLVAHMEKSMQEETGEDDELFLVDENGETRLSGYVGPDFENNLRVPLLEILKYPYLLLHERVSELCVEVLCRMELGHDAFQVFEKYPGIYLFLVHPNEVIRRWAILTARNLGKVDRDDYYDLEEVLTCLFKVIELGLFENPDIYSSSMYEKGKLILLPAHLYDTSNYKNYWLGICMLLSVLEEQAMDSLLLGPDKQNDFMQSILHTMEKEAADDSADPFWPALHCFMVILDQLGSKVWGQLIDPVQAFQTIINSESYKSEIKNIRSSFMRTKSEPEPDYGDDMITCSQIVYNYNTEKPQKDSGWKAAICPEYCPKMYEDMQTLASVLQSDLGKAMRVHPSTFLWFIPFVQSLMDLKELGVAYIVEVIHYLCSEIKDILIERLQQCDKISEFFLLILVCIVELHRNKKCLHLLWISSQEWVEAVVRCATLPARVFTWRMDKTSGPCGKGSSSGSFQASNSVQHACVQLIRSLLKEGYQIGQQALCKRYLDKLNLLLRGNLSMGWQLNIQETQELQTCLKQVIRSIKGRALSASVAGGSNSNSTALPTVSIKLEKNVGDNGFRTSAHERGDLHSPFVISKESGDCQGNLFPRRKNAWEEESRDAPKSSTSWTATGGTLMDIKKGPDDLAAQEFISLAAKLCRKVQENRNDDFMTGKCNMDNQGCKSNAQHSDFRRGRELKVKEEAGPSTAGYLSAQTHLGSSSSRNGKSVQETSVNSVFQSRVVPTKQGSTETSLDCSDCPKNGPGMQEKEDNSVLLLGINDTSLKKVSTEEKSGSLLKAVSKNNTDMPTSDWEQPNLNDLAKYDCKHQFSNAFCTNKFSANGCFPSRSENKRDVSNPAPQIRPLSVKHESSDRLLEFSEYFKRENISEGKKEDIVTMVSEDDTLSDSQVDRELSKLSLAAYAKSVNFPLESSQESSVYHNLSDIRRKVKGAVRSSNEGQGTRSLCDADCPGNQVIIISDSSDEEKGVDDKEETKTKNENVCPAELPSTSNSVSDSDTRMESESPGPSLSLDDCDSQYFEFETDTEMFSAWQDTQAYATEATQEYKQDDVSTAVESSSDDFLTSSINEWGYDLDYLSDDTMEEAASSVEKQVEDISHEKEADDKKKTTNLMLQESVSKKDAKGQLEKHADEGTAAEGFTLGSPLPEPRASTSTISLASKLAWKKNTTSPPKAAAKSKLAITVQRSPKNPAAKTAQTKKLLQSTSGRPQPGRSTPAVVPPRKVRQRPAPTSTAEKLGLKKGPRKACELSQPSRESVAQLRSHGKAAGRVGAAQKLRTKLIDAQSLSVKRNKKLLACQDRQFLRQMRPKRSAKVKSPAGSSESRSKKGAGVRVKSVGQKPQSFELASVESQREKRREETAGPSASERKFESLSVEEGACGSKMPGSSDWNRKWEDNSVMAPVPMDSSLSSTALGDDKDESSGKSCTVLPESEMKTSKPNGCKSYESNEEDDDNLFLTQLDPVDMELCSQEESFEDTAIASKTPEEMNVTESLQQNESPAIPKCQYKDCMEKVEKPGESCSKHAATSSGADHVFAKPSLPPPKVRKPSTTKIFSSVSSSRNAAFSKDLEDVKKLPPPSKSKVNAAKPAVVRPPLPKVYTPIGNQLCKAPTSSNVPQPQISNNILQSQNRQYDNALNISRGSGRGAYSSFLGAQQRDYSVFVNQVLKWTYEMFANFSCFGTPNNLLQSVVASVPVQFQDYNDYFNTFFPLMMLNAFETLAQEWVENQKAREKSYCFTLENFSADMNTAHFTAHFREGDLARQLHPKEDDLILLVVQMEEDTFGEESGMENHVMNHVGLVTRFSRASGYTARQQEQHTVCHLTVQTRGNLSFCIHKQVKCVVVGSLVTTHRTFKGLLLLSRSPLARPIINPCYNDFCPRDLPVASGSAASYMNEYNEDQKRAIETAYAMLKQHPGLPKICLIHGPPGTGKSKTIVGLLSRVLRENTRNEKTARKKNSKMKPNRFLVCAPSNAAVDELMKKIIVAFKEKCQNKQEPLGNCGDIKLVRLGAEKAINNEVRAFSLDKQVEHRMKRKPGDSDQDVQKRKAALDQKLDMLSRQRAMHRCEKRESQMLDEEIARLAKERQQLASQQKEVRGHSQKVQTDIILESDIICCTLSTSGGSLLESAFARQGHDPFSCVIVDEAGQSCEVETLIPLIHRCNKLVLVGDPKQLPPTVKSVKAQQYGYDQSLMARLQRLLEEQVQRNVLRSLPVVQLTVQYRMHPDICLFPSNYVYGKTLKTAKAIEENRCSSDWPFQPYLIFDVADGREERDCDSYSNPREVKLVMELIRTIKEKRKDLGLRRIGIITPYSAQKKRIQGQLDSVFRNNSPGEVDTVDAFQGREKDCIIVSCVRANSSEGSALTYVQANSTKGSIGFLASLQRLNVTITRARFSLFILGRLQTLMEDKNWNHLIQDAQKRGAIIRTVEKNYKKDALKILKLRPAVQLPAKAGTMTAPLVQAGSNSGKRGELSNPGSSPREAAAGLGHAVPQGSRGPPQPPGAPATDSRRGSAPASMGTPAGDSRRANVPVPTGTPAADSRRGSAPAPMGAPATDSRRSSAPVSMGTPAGDSRRGSAPASMGTPAGDSRRGSAPVPVGAAALPANPEKPRDPRLASRTETKGKEQALKDGSWSAQSNPGSTSQQGLNASSAARDQISRTENLGKAQQTTGQCNVLSTSHTAQHEGDRRGAVSKSGSKPLSEGGQSNSSGGNKDCRGLTRRPSEEPPENTESGTPKRRKIFH